MGWKEGDGLGKHRKVTTTKLRAYRCSRIMSMTEKVSGKDSGGRARCRRCGKTEMDMTVEEMRQGNRIDVGRRR